MDFNADKAALKEAIRKFSYRENHAEPFTLASGKKSPYYFDLKQTLLQPQYLRLAGRLVAATIGERYVGDVVAAGLTMGADPIIYAACLSRENPPLLIPAIVRKEAKDHGTGKKIEMLKGIDTTTPCVMVDDVITTAGSTLKAFAAMREAGYSIRHAVCILDRGEGGREALAQNGVELLSIYTAVEFKEK
ncbi:MAG: orotate phosphoribosyltransferase [Leptospiraceae bacterium]|nr:orotate phosphoribosyltransferase [Leptospiraceae bacterium]